MPTDDRRVASLERWREVMDTERGAIARDIGKLTSRVDTVEKTIRSDIAELKDMLQERPSRVEVESITRRRSPLPSSEVILTKAGLTLKNLSGPALVGVLAVLVGGLVTWLLRR